MVDISEEELMSDVPDVTGMTMGEIRTNPELSKAIERIHEQAAQPLEESETRTSD